MRLQEGSWLKIVPGIAWAILVLPAAAGLVGVVLPAFGYFPSLGRSGFSVEPWRQLLDAPGFLRSLMVTVWVGLAATLTSLLIVIAIFAQFHNSQIFWLARRTLSPLLSIPHVAIAIGVAFVIAPSGLLFRLLAQFLPGLENPPDLLIVHDSFGLSLIGVLVLKEVPFLFLMSLAALPQINPYGSLASARMMGYLPSIAWLKVVLPRLYPQIRLPVLAVLAYSLSIVDAALILGPTTPPTLGVAVFKWMNDPELGKRFLAAAGALSIFGITILCIGLWIVAERLVGRVGRQWIEQGSREQGAGVTAIAAYTVGAVLLVFILLSAGAILLWSFAEHWPYPRALPESFSTNIWKANAWLTAKPLWNALLIGLSAALVSVVVTLSLLERDVRRGLTINPWMRNLLYFPLLIPQIAFLPGLQILLIAAGLDSNIYSVTAAHIMFVLPYVYLSLSQPWAYFDDRYRQAALSMGATPRQAFLKVRMPILFASLLTAFAVGFAVSVGQYLPTLLFGSGRVPTITTEAVALASGGDRRLTASLALLQSLLPFLAFVVAIFVPLALYRNRRGVRFS